MMSFPPQGVVKIARTPSTASRAPQKRRAMPPPTAGAPARERARPKGPPKRLGCRRPFVALGAKPPDNCRASVGPNALVGDAPHDRPKNKPCAPWRDPTTRNDRHGSRPCGLAIGNKMPCLRSATAGPTWPRPICAAATRRACPNLGQPLGAMGSKWGRTRSSSAGVVSEVPQSWGKQTKSATGAPELAWPTQRPIQGPESGMFSSGVGVSRPTHADHSPDVARVTKIDQATAKFGPRSAKVGSNFVSTRRDLDSTQVRPKSTNAAPSVFPS